MSKIGEDSEDCEERGDHIPRLYNTSNAFGNKRKVREWTVITN